MGLAFLRTMNRRAFLKETPLAAAALALANPVRILAAAQDDPISGQVSSSYKYRIAFGAWINDLRMTPLPLENWPAPQLDDEAIACSGDARGMGQSQARSAQRGPSQEISSIHSFHCFLPKD